MRAAGGMALTGLVRSPGRVAVRVLVLAAAVGLLGAVVLFIGNSLRTMTGSTIRSVPLDWQGPVGSYQAARSVAGEVAQGSIRSAFRSKTGFASAVSRGGDGLPIPVGGSGRQPTAARIGRDVDCRRIKI